MSEKSEVRSQKAEGQSLLAVFAHPDDESLACGGLLAWCAALGVRVSLLCVTHGAHARANDTSPPTVDDIRAAELRDAAGCLGVDIDAVTLLDYEDGMLAWVDADPLEQAIRTEIRRLRPDVVITFDEDGLYWHPDHIAVHERTTAVIAALDIDDAAPTLYYVTMPSGAMRAVVSHGAAVTASRDPYAAPPGSILGVEDADAFGAEAAPPSLVVKTGTYAVRKLRALACHRSQFRDCALALVGEDDAPHLLGTEQYRRANVGAQHDTFIEQLAAPQAALESGSAQT
ncbi:MAG: PIG-L deacetylase family protein [Vicinamibacterales bacterium]|jgi:LmbE family N-acetylglucosaminyl deacetylase|nr:PIG-L deacetylase family protein [Vicinamibacterales bacterium]